ncbi:MAG: ABC transporter permease subunit [Clostridiales bacterium]|nr:ABC transporter permease subunit [Clostridiales bacterium]
MAFLKQIKFEIKNILKSRFILIIGIFVLVVAMAIPTLGFIVERYRERKYEDRYYPGMIRREISYVGGGGHQRFDGESPIIVDGVTIEPDNPFYWRFQDLEYEKEAIESDKERFPDAETQKLALEALDEEGKFYASMAEHIISSRDYREDLAWIAMEGIYSKFIYEHPDAPGEGLYQAVGHKIGMDMESFKEKYIDITESDRSKALAETDEKLNAILNVVINNDFPQYIALQLEQEKKRIENLEEQIATQEELIVKNPSQEEGINWHIEDLKREIAMIETNSIPTLEYRLENNIIPREDSWQNTALSNIEMNQMNILHNNIIPEEEFNKERYMIEEYKSYQKYVDAMQSQIDGYNNEILIAQSSLDAGKPDMKYVINGARSNTVGFLGYSIFVAIYAVLIGSWIIASEFQQGTIRLLLIRPKTRTKILMAKFIAALSITLVIYIAGSFINMLANGMFYGFADFRYPNYTISGEISFFRYYIPKLLACSVSIIFGYTVAFMFSVMLKNIAVSLIIPIVCLIGSSIAMQVFAFTPKLDWIAYTPIPFVQISSFFQKHSSVYYALQRGANLNLTYGIILLLAMSIVFTVVSVVIFKNRDITN